MKKVAIYTLGCKVNQYESESVMGLFKDQGYEIVAFEDKADIYVINTCTVTGLSDRKSRQFIRKAKENNKHAIVVVMGCYAQIAADEVSKIPGVNLVVGTKDRKNLINYIKEIELADNDNLTKNIVTDIMKTHEFEELGVSLYKQHTRAFLKVQEGCNQFCSYCIIPFARGPVRSRPLENILDEVTKLGQTGFKEIVLTGIHLASYGVDFKSITLIDLIKKVHEINGIERIRLGSIEPTLIDNNFITAIKDLPKICPHLHISLQSGCDDTLKRMNRKYSTEDYRKAVNMLRESIEDVAISTDVMVGFPGETDEEFEITYKFLEEINFSSMHVFKYSPRKGTKAANFPEQIVPNVKDERSNNILQLANRCSYEFNNKYVGRVMPVLLEQEVKSKKGYQEGLTTNYIRVICKANDTIVGNISNVRIEKAGHDYVEGNL